MAHHYSDTTLSEPPLSPFSTRSLLSDGTQTSDEPADLGAFRTVFRALNQLHLQQQQSFNLPTPPPRSDSRATHYNSESESEAANSSTVWSQDPIASYLRRDDGNESVHSHSTSISPEVLTEEEEEEEEASDLSETEGRFEEETESDGISPSLGYLESALGFLAAEKAKLAAAHLEGRSTGISSSESAWRHVIEPRRKRRRRRKGGGSGLSRTVEQDEEPAAGTRAATAVPSPEGSSSPGQPSSLDKDGGAIDSYLDPSTNTNTKRHRQRAAAQVLTRTQSQQRLPGPSSAPIPIPRSFAAPPDPRIVRLRALANRLRHDFPQNSTSLAHVLAEDFPHNDIIDPRGPEPQSRDALTHVFIDHSNILVGFLNNVKRSRRMPQGKPLMSFAALALILERGRPIMRRVLATSSPLYQNMDAAESLGYHVYIFARVPDFSAESASNSSGNITTNSNVSYHYGSSVSLGASSRLVKGRKAAAAAVTTAPTNGTTTMAALDADPGLGPPLLSSSSSSHSRANAARAAYTHSRTISASSLSTSPSSSTPLANNAGAVPGRVRYREQGVDELLQLKLHQALVSPGADPPPAGATIVLATGDGASGQFNEDGFVGVVRTALKKGWMVELYAWGGGLSGTWRKMAEEEARLRVWEMDPYLGDLLETSGGGFAL